MQRRGPRKAQGFLADKQRALNFYRIFSAAYDILNPYLYTDKMRDEIVSQIKIGADLRVLDVGCGTGYTTLGVLNRRDVCEVVGLDMNPVQLNRAPKNCIQKKPGYPFREVMQRTCHLSMSLLMQLFPLEP